MKESFSENEISDVAFKVFEKIHQSRNQEHATIVTLSGDLGAGKTTLTKALARIFGITETVISPTYVIMKNYKLEIENFKLLIHIDAYRLESDDELLRLGWEELIASPENIVLIEWPERVERLIPEYAIQIKLSHADENTRHISLG